MDQEWQEKLSEADWARMVSMSGTDFTQLSDRELLLALHFRLSVIFNRVDTMMDAVMPMIENISNGPLGGMLGL